MNVGKVRRAAEVLKGVGIHSALHNYASTMAQVVARPTMTWSLLSTIL